MMKSTRDIASFSGPTWFQSRSYRQANKVVVNVRDGIEEWKSEWVTHVPTVLRRRMIDSRWSPNHLSQIVHGERSAVYTL